MIWVARVVNNGATSRKASTAMIRRGREEGRREDVLQSEHQDLKKGFLLNGHQSSLSSKVELYNYTTPLC